MRRMLAGAVMFAQIRCGKHRRHRSSLAVRHGDRDVPHERTGAGTLELLMLWRGSPGWFRKSGGGASGGGGTGGSMGGGPGPMVRTAWVSQGGVNLMVRFDPVARIAWIQDKEIVAERCERRARGWRRLARRSADRPHAPHRSCLRHGDRLAARHAERARPPAAANHSNSNVHPPIARARRVSPMRRTVVPGLQRYEQQVFDDVVQVGHAAVKKKSARPSTVAGYLRALPSEQRGVLTKLRQVIRKHLPKGYKEATNWGAITYEVPLKRCPDTYNGQPLCYLAIAAQKNYLSLYLMTVYGDPAKKKQLEDGFARAGKRLDMGKSCIRFRSLDDLPLDTVADIIASTPVDTYVAAYREQERSIDQTKPRLMSHKNRRRVVRRSLVRVLGVLSDLLESARRHFRAPAHLPSHRLVLSAPRW